MLPFSIVSENVTKSTKSFSTNLSYLFKKTHYVEKMAHKLGREETKGDKQEIKNEKGPQPETKTFSKPKTTQPNHKNVKI